MITVLSVDDEPALLELFKHFLENEGSFSVDTCTSAETAWDLLKTQPYDAIVADYQMPGMDGIAFLKAVRERYGDIPFILFTGRGREEVVIEALNNGADFYLRKGGDPQSQFAGISHKIHRAIRRKYAEQELHRSEALFRGMAERSSELIIIIDKEGGVSYASPSSRLIIGYVPEELIGKIRDFTALSIFSACSSELMAAVQSVKDGLTVENIEMQIIKKDGTTGHVNMHAVPIMHEGIFAGAQVSMQDITERVQAEQALRESEEKYRDLVETTTDWIWETDLEGKHTYSNPAILDLLGYSVSEIMGTSAFPLIHPDDESRLRELIATCINDKEYKSYTTTIRWLKKDGSARLFESAIKPIVNTKGELTGFRGIDRDITERKQAEEALLLANKKLTILNSITRHDINNQIMVLMTYLSLLGETENDPMNNEYCRKASAAAERISAMIRFTKDYEQVGVQTPVWHDLRTLVDIAARQVALGKVVLRNDIPGDVEIFSDPLIEKVIYNLIENAIRYGNTITTIRFSLHDRDENRLIVCEDDGDGVAVDEKEKIFERGFGKNTGLGLALSREILGITGITITETGEPGWGARFEMVVPDTACRTVPVTRLPP